MAELEIQETFPELIGLAASELAAMRKDLIGDAQNYKVLDDTALLKLSAILRLLRRKASGPPRTKTSSKMSIEDFAVEE